MAVGLYVIRSYPGQPYDLCQIVGVIGDHAITRDLDENGKPIPVLGGFRLVLTEAGWEDEDGNYLIFFHTLKEAESFLLAEMQRDGRSEAH